MNILYYDNCWFTNVGEAFIDIGAMGLIKNIFPEANIACCSNMSEYYCLDKVKNLQMSDMFYKYFDCDYFILAGMMATEGHLASREADMVRYFRSRGAKIIYLGLGSGLYSEQERNAFSAYLENIKPELVMTRDKYTFDIYKNIVSCIEGIDCAFWVRDCFNPKGFAKKHYNIISFNRSKEPTEIALRYKNQEILRLWHMQYSIKEKNISPNTIVSDSPYDYLTLYANASEVCTDLVHATIVSLMYEIPVKYWYVDRRIEAIDELRNLKKQDGWLHIDNDSLEKQKKEIVNEITKTLARK